MPIEYTNYDSDWDAECAFCRNPQRDHQVDLGELDGVRYFHRQPCPEEQRQITKRALIDANKLRIVLTLYEVALYLWSKIPFKAEARILWRLTSQTYVGVRGVLYYWFKYREK